MARIAAHLALALAVLPGPGALGQDLRPPGWDDIAAVFQKRCVNCHSEIGASKGLRLDSYEAVIAGSARGAVVVANDPPDSELVRRILGQSTPRMPFLSVPLPQEEIDLIVRWIEAGLPKERAAD